MKNALLAAGLILCGLLAALCIWSSESSQIRQREQWTALHHAMEQTMESLAGGAGGIDSDEKLAAEFMEKFLLYIDSDSTVDVTVHTADVREGLLDVEVTETFRYPNGRQGQVTARKTMIIEEKN